ncbi:DUF2963 domain-containing protein [Candidatus Phytoplasma solani]|uniref:DUF2963 domain-containing protein n=1 Tax=Candidatus Phytoplasma solani TaxID=69896 RepID=UPI00358E3548
MCFSKIKEFHLKNMLIIWKLFWLVIIFMFCLFLVVVYYKVYFSKEFLVVTQPLPLTIKEDTFKADKLIVKDKSCQTTIKSSINISKKTFKNQSQSKHIKTCCHEKRFFYPDNKTINYIEKYDLLTQNCTQINYYNHNGTLFCVMKFDPITKYITKITYHQSDGVTISNIAKYNPQNGKKIQQIQYDANGMTIDYIDQYNDNEEKIQTIKYIIIECKNNLLN